MRLAQALEHTLATRLFSATPLARCGQASISCIRMGFLGGMFDRACRIESRHRSGGVGRHHRRRASARAPVPARGQPRHGQDDDRDAVPDGRRRGGRARRSTSPCPRPRTSCARAPRRTAGRSTGVDIFELVPPESLLDEDQQQSLLYSSDLELGETTKRIFEAFERVKPDRVVLDSLSEIRLLAQCSLRYRRQILALKHYFARSGATVLMLDDLTSEAQRQDHAQRRARRDPAGGAVARIWRRAAPAAGHQISRPALPRRLSRLHHRHRRRARLPAAGLRRAPHELQARGARNAARRSSTRCSAAASSAARAC